MMGLDLPCCAAMSIVDPGALPAMTTRRLSVLDRSFRPLYVVWELTLACDQPCSHCGSRAGSERPSEFSTQEALQVVAQLATMGTQELVLIGGEAYLHPGFLRITAALAERGIRVLLTTGGRGITDELCQQMKAAGLAQVSVSIDGLAERHDLLRANRGSFAAATRALTLVKKAGLVATANTNLNRLNRDDLESLYDHLRELEISSWQVQITTPLGRAADRPDLILQPYDLLDVLPRLAALKERAYRDGILIMPGNNLGYFGKEEALLRSLRLDGVDHFSGCQAGRFVLGIESDGAIKGCPSLQTAHYVGGNLRNSTLSAIWESSPELSFARARTIDDLWGFCRDCHFAAVCLGGCTFTAHAVLGRPGNNPYCHFRARSFAKLHQRERLVPVEAATGLPFDNGRFAIVVEPIDAPEPASLAPRQLLQIRRLQNPRPTDAP